MISINQKITGYAVRSADDGPQEDRKLVDDADRRLKISGTPVPPTASLRWNKRPSLPGGNPSWMHIVDSPEGKFWIVVGHIQNGSPLTGTPFEVWAVGSEAPRGLSDLARSLSIDLRSQDRAWLRRKLEALEKTPGESFVLTMPDGKQVMANSAVSAFAKLLAYRCEELGAFSDEKLQDTPVIDALMSKHEPKTTGLGNMAWYFDVNNHNTGDQFHLVLKEADLDGQTRPFSVWLDGNSVPASLQGLAKSLSLDMRVSEPGWLARKLQQLVDVVEPRGEFFAVIPGEVQKQRCYPSTVAYIAEVIQFRFKQLGLFNESGLASVDNGVVQLSEARQARKDAAQAQVGANCNDCGAVGTVIKLDGCLTCRECAASSCG